MSAQRPRWQSWLLTLRRYVTFFLTMAFVISCCMLLFVSQLQATLGVEFTREQISRAAQLTFGNVVLLSVLCTVVDEVRRRFLVARPVRQITRAAEKITRGDFSVRIPPLGVWGEDGFDVIAESFNKLAQELSGMETLRSDFIANVSHELKTPLTVLQNYGTLLRPPGLSEEQLKKVEEASKEIAILKSANMSLGINLLLKLLKSAAAVLAPAGYDMEIVERHHNQKLDAPSGTALALADSLNDALDREYHYVYDRSQVRQKREKKEIGISAVRGGTIVGDHEVIFAGTDEVIEFRHSAYSRSVFAKGAVEAGKYLAGKAAGMYDMGDVVGL